MAHSVPDQSFVYSFVFMPVDVASGGDSNPVDFGVPICQLLRKSPSRLGHNLQSAHNRVYRLSVRAESRKVELSGETFDRVDVFDDVAQALSRVLRRHGSRRAKCSRGAAV